MSYPLRQVLVVPPDVTMLDWDTLCIDLRERSRRYEALLKRASEGLYLLALDGNVRARRLLYKILAAVRQPEPQLKHKE